MNFTIAEEFFTNVDNTTEVEINGSINKFIGSKDHEEFTKLRHELAADGYISLELRFVNGDRVLKPFTLNGYAFNINEQFPCASAMKFRMRK